MRIALFTDTFPPDLNGVARALGLLVEHAVRHGHEMAVVTPRSSEMTLPDQVLHVALPATKLPFYQEVHATRPYLGRRHRASLAQFRPELVHAATEAPVGWIGRHWALTHEVPLVTSFCTNFPEYLAGYGMGFLEGISWSYLRRFHGRGCLTLCPSHATRAELLGRGFHHRVRIWGRGVDSRAFHPEHRRETLRRRWAPDGQVVLLYVGRIAPEKRIDLLIEAFPAIRAQSSRDVRLVLVGGGPALDSLRRRVPEGVYFTGYQKGPHLAAHYASGDIFLFPSDTETFGQVVTEAMASGLPVVAPARGGVQNTVLPGRTGFLFPPGDTTSLVDAAVRLVDDPALRSRLGLAARDAAMTHSWERVFSKLFQDYSECIPERDETVTAREPGRAHGGLNF
jgi:phosphatidylinositol alpha 1,6-mannosyltransferase